jgi:hypothetical protein
MSSYVTHTHTHAHAQVVEDGYEFFARRQLVTLFSAPNYCGEFDNAGAMMSVDATLMCSFHILKSSEVRAWAGGKPSPAPCDCFRRRTSRSVLCLHRKHLPIEDHGSCWSLACVH